MEGSGFSLRASLEGSEMYRDWRSRSLGYRACGVRCARIWENCKASSSKNSPPAHLCDSWR